MAVIGGTTGWVYMVVVGQKQAGDAFQEILGLVLAMSPLVRDSSPGEDSLIGPVLTLGESVVL